MTGEVKKPGPLDLPAGGLPLSQAIAMSYGNTSEAKVKQIKIYRHKQGSSEPEVLVANLESIKAGTTKDVMLEPYDIVEVGKAKKSFGQILQDALISLPNRVPIPIP
jgi:protein involved in polysaccharide export with SLBB domain